MADLKSLLPRAAQIRDATGEKENTALRVGSLLLDMINNTAGAVTTEKSARESADSTLQTRVTEAKQSASAAQSTADSAKYVANEAKAVTDSKGQPGGLAELDANGKVTAEELPATVYNVVEFDGLLSTPTAPTVEPTSATQGNIYFLPATNTFLRRNGNATTVKYYANWPDADAFGAFSGSGRVPKRNTIYIDSTGKKQYFYDGSTLVALDTDIIRRIELQTPVRCTDETDLESKAASEAYAEGQQFYIPEDEG